MNQYINSAISIANRFFFALRLSIKKPKSKKIRDAPNSKIKYVSFFHAAQQTNTILIGHFQDFWNILGNNGDVRRECVVN